MKNKPDAIISSDWHIMDKSPVCRTDDYIDTQFNKIAFIRNLQREYKCPVLFAGDLYDKWKPSPYTIARTMEVLPERLVGIAGNHDQPAHSLERLNESGFNVLDVADYINYEPDSLNFDFNLRIHHFGEEYIKPIKTKGIKNVALIHEYVYKGRKPFPGQLTGVTQMMKKLKGYDLIVVGDNHVPFTHRIGNQLLVNPGSLTRHKADQINHKPRVYLWYAKTNTVEPVYIPIEKNVITRDHIKKDRQRDKRIEAFVHSLEDGAEVHLSFEKNIKNIINDTPKKSVRKKIQGAIDGY